jgi:ATP-dependent helicase/nuclease subunit A
MSRIDVGAAFRRPNDADQEARLRAVDPRFNVALEASAGTGKTRVLVDRYVNLLRAGVDPANILAMTFTRKAAAEMRERIVGTLRTAADRGELTAGQWRAIRDRLGDIAISTIDAFCLSLLREFPLEADIDPGFSLADDTEVPRLIDESLDRALRICRGMAREDEHVALVFAQLGDRRVRAGLASLLNRRLVAPSALSRYLTRAPRNLTMAEASRRGAEALRGVFEGMQGGLPRFVATAPAGEPGFALLRHQLGAMDPAEPASVQAAFARAREYFLTQDGQPRSRMLYTKAQFNRPADWEAHRQLVVGHAPRLLDAWRGFRRDLNVLVSRGVSRMFRIAEAEYRRTLDAHAVLDFSDVLLKALDLLRQMEEFSQSRYRLESRYHHVLVDEFQDTSRAQWELISLLVQSWGHGAGLTASGPLPPSIFIVGDRKQSIYGFRDAQASILREAAAHLDGLRPDGGVRRTISRSFRAVPELLAFVNSVCEQIEKAPSRPDAFHYEEGDRLVGATHASPVPEAGSDSARATHASPLQFLAADSPEACAEGVAGEIAGLIGSGATVRDRETGVYRAVRPGDIAILFRTRESHREFEDALGRRGVPSYVYKGLGFFDTDEVKDVLSLIWYLADPSSDLRAAAFLRSRFVRITDEGLRRLAPDFSGALRSAALPDDLDPLDVEGLAAARSASKRWRELVDRIPPAELLDLVLSESAYAVETRGPRAIQARENLKKLRALIRRIQNRGYATLGRLAAHLDRLAVGDDANAVIDASGAVNLMTIHAAKGLEFPIVFLVNLARGTGNRRAPIRVTALDGDADAAVAVGDFQSEADDDEVSREREETKRLLYVALTRARDRMYLSTPLKEGRVVAGRGSLAEVLPPAVIAQLEAVGARRVHKDPPYEGAVGQVLSDPPHEPSDLLPVTDASIPRIAVGSAIGTGDFVDGGGSSTPLIGRLVHRLLQVAPDPASDDAALRAHVERALRGVETGELDRESVVARTLSAFRALSGDPEVQALYASGRALPEVPFTLRDGDRTVRGTVDCLILHPGGVTILEFKTGRPRPEHENQVELYTRAVRAAYPSMTVSARLFYPRTELTGRFDGLNQ